MTDKRQRMIFTISDDERAALEKVRQRRGLRSHAEALRFLIMDAVSSGLPTPERQAEMKAEVARRQAKPAAPAEFKSRLKGQWKAP